MSVIVLTTDKTDTYLCEMGRGSFSPLLDEIVEFLEETMAENPEEASAAASLYSYYDNVLPADTVKTVYDLMTRDKDEGLETNLLSHVYSAFCTEPSTEQYLPVFVTADYVGFGNPRLSDPIRNVEGTATASAEVFERLSALSSKLDNQRWEAMDYFVYGRHIPEWNSSVTFDFTAPIYGVEVPAVARLINAFGRAVMMNEGIKFSE